MPEQEHSPAESSAEVRGVSGSTHDATGLDVARSVAAGARGAARAAKQRTRSGRRSAQPEYSGPRPGVRDPAMVGTAVDKLVTDNGWTTELAVHGVFGRWSSIVGIEIAGHCSPESFADGHLQVRTDSTSWATQLRLLAPTVVRRLNEELGDGTVLRIDIVGPASPSWRKGRRAVRDGRGPRDTYG
ncbi:MAG: DUF721 domain-containing protein [Nocardioidaceae bacterium]